MAGEIEIVGHAAPALDAAAERHRDQAAGKIVRPLMIGADELVRSAGKLTAEFGRPMRAAILKHMNGAILRAGDDDGCRPDIRADEVAGIGYLALERDVAPGSAVENFFNLARVDGRVGIDPVGNTGEPLGGPDVWGALRLDVCGRNCGRNSLALPLVHGGEGAGLARAAGCALAL